MAAEPQKNFLAAYNMAVASCEPPLLLGASPNSWPIHYCLQFAWNNLHPDQKDRYKHIDEIQRNFSLTLLTHFVDGVSLLL